MKKHAAPLRVAPALETEFPGADFRATEAIINLVRADGLVTGSIATYLRRYDLTPATFNVLMILRHAENGSLCPHEIGDRLLVTRGTVTGLVDSLERRGLITRHPHPEDRRMVTVSITKRALDLMTELLPGHFANEREMLAGLTDREKDTLVRLLGKVQNALSS